MIEIASAAIAYKADNWAGDGKKWLGYSFYTLAILFPLLPFMADMGVYGLILIPCALICALSLRKWGVWGELFPTENKGVFTTKYKWFYRIVDKIYGKSYLSLNNQNLRLWKVLGWAVRYAIYGLPLILLYVIASDSITPLFVIPLAGLVRGIVYMYALTQKNLAFGEKWGGALSMLLIGGCV